MKHFYIILFTFLGFSFISEAQDLTPETVQRRLERNESRLESEKQRTNAKTWVDRGIIFQDIYDVNIQFLYLGMPREEVRLFMGDPKETRTEETETGVKNVLVYENINLHFEDGQLSGWEETKVIHEAPLEEAHSALNRAIEIEEKGESGGGFFSRIFGGGSQERRITDAFLRLHGQFISQAVIQYEKTNFDDSFNSFKRAIEIAESPYYTEPLDTGLVFNTGFVAALAGNDEASLEYLTRAKDMGYGESGLYLLLKEAHIALGDSLMAEKTLQEGFQKFPQDNSILVEMINFYIFAENEQEALNYLNLAKQQDPKNPSFHYAEGAIYDQLGDTEKAKESYQRSLELDPDFFDANYNMGILHYNRAVDMLTAANEIMDNRKYEIARDEAYDVLRVAIPYLEQAHQLDPDHPSTMETLRIIYYRLGMEKELEDMNTKLGRELLQ
jgi:tetratricopeptide (TPR) repeat protein